MNVSQASKVVMTIGQHKGKTIDKIASTDKGLRDLDWLLGQPWLFDDLKKAIACYLNHPPIAADLERALESKDAR